jgi:predicted transcriptional regulator
MDEGARRIAGLPVREMMIPLQDYPTVCAKDTVGEAIAKMEAAALDVAGQRSLPRVLLVLADGNHLVGIVRRRDILRALIPEFLRRAPLRHHKNPFHISVDHNLAELSLESIVSAMHRHAEYPVSTVMRPLPASIEEDDHLLKAISEMVNEDLAILPVMRGKQVVGVVRSVDVFRELVQLLP